MLGDVECSRAATSGFNELRQFERFAASRLEPSAGPIVCRYNVSELRETHICLRFHIRQICPAGVPYAVIGGASFRIEALGARLELCSVIDRFDGTYAVGCAKPRMGCTSIRVELGFEGYSAFANAVPGGSLLGFMYGKAQNGYRAPRMQLLSTHRWCARAGAVADRDSPGPPTMLFCGRAAISAASEGAWLSTIAANSTSAQSAFTRRNSSSAFAPSPWWESRWRWSADDRCSSNLHAGLSGGSLAAGGKLSEGVIDEPTSLEGAGIATLDLIGESHLGFLADCLQGELYSRYPPSREHTHAPPHAIRPSEASSSSSSARHSPTKSSPAAGGPRAHHRPPSPPSSHASEVGRHFDGGAAAATSMEAAAAIAHLHNCSGRAAGCWPAGVNRATGVAKRYLPYQSVGQRAFSRVCSKWSVASSSDAASPVAGAALPPQPSSPTPAILSTPRAASSRTPAAPRSTLVCKHGGGNGFFRAAMTLRLMIADAEAFVASGEAHPLSERNVLVVQESSWDLAAMPHLRLVLEHIDEFISAVRALRASTATQGALEAACVLATRPAQPTHPTNWRVLLGPKPDPPQRPTCAMCAQAVGSSTSTASQQTPGNARRVCAALGRLRQLMHTSLENLLLPQGTIIEHCVWSWLTRCV